MYIALRLHCVESCIDFRTHRKQQFEYSTGLERDPNSKLLYSGEYSIEVQSAFGLSLLFAFTITLFIT